MTQTTTKALQTTLKLRHEPIRFSTPEAARHFADRCTRPMWVVLGDAARAWVVCPADAARLERAGYEIA
jgi:hypothetical protein